jgi:hypothetical protein
MMAAKKQGSRRGRIVRAILAVATGIVTLGVTACHSNWIDVSVENRTGKPLRELEVSYPSASFGFDSLAPDDVKHYRLQVRGRGEVKVMYALPDGTVPRATGPALADHAQGKLTIRLLPQGRVDFQPEIHQVP